MYSITLMLLLLRVLIVF